MPTGFEGNCTDVGGNFAFLLLSKRLNSLMLLSAWRWSGSCVMPESVQDAYLVLDAGPNTLAEISNLFSIPLRIQLKASIRPVIVKSSPCTVKKSSFLFVKEVAW